MRPSSLQQPSLPHRTLLSRRWSRVIMTLLLWGRRSWAARWPNQLCGAAVTKHCGKRAGNANADRPVFLLAHLRRQFFSANSPPYQGDSTSVIPPHPPGRGRYPPRPEPLQPQVSAVARLGRWRALWHDLRPRY